MANGERRSGRGECENGAKATHSVPLDYASLMDKLRCEDSPILSSADNDSKNLPDPI